MSRSISFDRVAEEYDSTRGLPPDVMERVTERLGVYLSNRGICKILDVGTGTGRFAIKLQELGFEVVGIDISAKMLGLARAKSVHGLVQADMRRMPFKTGSFDAAMSVHVLHLVREWRLALEEIRRVATKTYFSVVSVFSPPTPNRIADFYERKLLETGWPEVHPGVHERDLLEIIPPAENECLTEYSRESKAEEEIDVLQRRTWSSLWDVPEDLHQRIISELRDEFRGRRMRSSVKLHICSWEMDRLEPKGT